MGFNQFIKAFLPQDKVFYSIFEDMGSNLIKMAKIYKDALNTSSINERNTKLLSLEQYEHINDHLTHNVFIELSKNFITPFDREDIHNLAKVMDDVADYMHSSSKRIVHYNLVEIDNYMLGFCNLMLESIEMLAKAVNELRSMKNLRNVAEACVAINSLEGKADDLYDEAISSLFDSDYDTLTIVKLKDIYEEMEIVTDKCEDSADVIESIIIKYS